MKEKIYNLSLQDQENFNNMRQWLLAHFNGDIQSVYATVEGKIYIVDAIFRAAPLNGDDVFELQALGVGFGDALAQAKGLEWVIVEDQDGRLPELKLPGKAYRVGAFTAIQKRVALGEQDLNLPYLFSVFCHAFDESARPQQSLWRRLFGRRLVRTRAS